MAGTENVAIAVQWLIAYMVTYPEVQFKCRECIHEVSTDKLSYRLMMELFGVFGSYICVD